ncbi:hypothetical protein SPRG_22272 [Saprolegnia parasitica CBS 223.65]|uniref:DNA-directed primase/polymerase protein n=1 Tax=Saprolegnia parasitica (strain CBS 223.65) TaxID=695850 RepID=A0A067BWK0_SAPPC|nr:hypothetical protein SPRG_22272 [Saprolegnia parasitica CBS 223.65]KDO21180.1 hypothetical protein SPRG_22272 [Saprolegnia parasitica CBS 223.65]|eukprot:XP_012208118.1 hypothetical protein SPRG_22272 [Saprolegnia parasitica CBS 223.65]
MFSLELRISDELVGRVAVDVRTDGLVFQHKRKSMRLPIESMVSLMRDGDALVIATTLAQRDPLLFHCSEILAHEKFFLTLQTQLPAIPFERRRASTALERRLAKKRAPTDASSFYGPTQAPLTAQLGDAFGRELEYRIEHSMQCQIDGIARPYMAFALQQPAMAFLAACRATHPTTTARLYSYETPGSRRFLVADAALFCEKYLATAPHHRHVYEIIQENHPCRLYFDLEFTKAYNPTVTAPDALLDSLFRLLALAFYRDYGLRLERDAIVDLASSSAAKFSRHWVVAPKDNSGQSVLFQNNIHAGHFIKRMLETYLSDESHPFYVLKKDGTKQLFIDTGVYTRNRAFRLWLSSKYGSDRVLTRCEEAGEVPDAAFLEASYICPTSAIGARLLQCDPPTTSRHTGRGSVARAKSSAPTEYKYGPSPWPALDAFVRGQAIAGGVQGEIRSWQMHIDYPQRITYHMDRNRSAPTIGMRDTNDETGPS